MLVSLIHVSSERNGSMSGYRETLRREPFTGVTQGTRSNPGTAVTKCSSLRKKIHAANPLFLSTARWLRRRHIVVHLHWAWHYTKPSFCNVLVHWSLQPILSKMGMSPKTKPCGNILAACCYS